MAKLSDKFVAAAPLGEHADDLTHGLVLLVRRSTAKGRSGALRRSWVLRIVHAGKRRKIGLGPYPLITLAMARGKAVKAARDLFEGQDPTRVGRARMQDLTLTFGRAVDQYLSDIAPRFKNPKDERIRDLALRKHCARFNDKPVDKIAPREIAALLKALRPETALKTRTALNRVFAFAAVELAQRNITMRNPAALDLLTAVGYAPPRNSARGHQPAVDYREMPAVISALAEIRTPAARCVEFIVLTASRSKTARLARFDQIDVAESVWRVPAELMKDLRHRRGVFIVPLSPAALATIEAMRDANGKRAKPSPFIFAADDGEAITETKLILLNRALRRIGGWVDPDSGKPISIHGFRSSFRTFVEITRRQDAAIAELVMGHRAHGAIEARYVRGDGLLSERRNLLHAWADHCAGRSNIVSIRRA